MSWKQNDSDRGSVKAAVGASANPRPKVGPAVAGMIYHCCWICGLLLLFLNGCAVRHPLGEPLLAEERLRVETTILAAMAQRQARLQCLDAAAELSWRTLLRSHILPGYLQLMAPAHLKFIGLDPLGRPVLALTTDGPTFRLIVVPEAKVYEGATTAAAFSRHLPAGLTATKLPSSLFAWLSGGLPPAPEIVGVYRDSALGGYWLEIADPPGARFLFSHAKADELTKGGPVATWLPRRIRLHAPDGSQLMEIIYQDFQPIVGAGNGPEVLLPHQLEIKSNRRHGLSITIRLSDLLSDCKLGAVDFYLPIPPNFKLQTVE